MFCFLLYIIITSCLWAQNISIPNLIKHNLLIKFNKKHQLYILYKKNNFQPLWILPKQKQKQKICIKTLQQCFKEGLLPQDYFVNYKEQENNLYKKIKFEIELSQKTLLYIKDIEKGRIKTHYDLFKKKDTKWDAIDVLLDNNNQDPSGLWLEKLTFNSKSYLKLKKTLQRYLNIYSYGGWPKISINNTNLFNLRKILYLQKDLSLNDFFTTKSLNYIDKNLTKALRSFQYRHQLAITGKLNKQTIKALNISVEEKITNIKLSMEQLRSTPKNFGEHYILVLIPQFSLYVIQNGVEKLKLPAIVGRHYRKTPNFSCDMKEIIFHPTWYVPKNIAIRDKLPKLQKNPIEFVEKDYIILNLNKENIDPMQVNWQDYSKTNFPFLLRQKPGEHNALGRIKFIIDNPFRILIHGTPDQELFNKTKRTFSSGCIRINKPENLAKYLLQEELNWDSKKFEDIFIAKQNKKYKISFTCHIIYITVWVDMDGKVVFFQDVYKKNKKLQSQLAERKDTSTRA